MTRASSSSSFLWWATHLQRGRRGARGGPSPGVGSGWQHAGSRLPRTRAAASPAGGTPARRPAVHAVSGGTRGWLPLAMLPRVNRPGQPPWSTALALRQGEAPAPRHPPDVLLCLQHRHHRRPRQLQLPRVRPAGRIQGDWGEAGGLGRREGDGGARGPHPPTHRRRPRRRARLRRHWPDQPAPPPPPAAHFRCWIML
jgi:hypothetical protein